ncbi:MAG: YhcH/YjgK/YiaL family protein [Bacteroidaceae bacterium]|nr:YhcH/YjgK/YiaL family protein [Bacteroidaceae bacterium]
MIIDSLDRLRDYAWISPLMPQVISFISGTDMTRLKPGRIVLQADDLYVNADVNSPRDRKAAQIESHEKYIDIQIPLTADEEMGYMPQSMLPAAAVPYDESRDAAFYGNACDNWLQVRRGMFAVFFPGEGHAPAVTPVTAMKLVIKIKAHVEDNQK